MICIEDMEHTAVGVALICWSAGLLTPVQRDKFREVECAGTDHSAGKSSEVNKTHDDINE